MLCFHNRILRFFFSLRESHCCSHLNTNIPFQSDFSSEGESWKIWLTQVFSLSVSSSKAKASGLPPALQSELSSCAAGRETERKKEMCNSKAHGCYESCERTWSHKWKIPPGSGGGASPPSNEFSPLKSSMGRNAEGKTFPLVHSGVPASGSSSLPDKEAVHISHHLSALLFVWKQSRKKMCTPEALLTLLE